ncbi:hypothetical protein F441_21108 [Phytophthora nicotianae CJ01A1]|uniref:Uncharacterized protein n=6 Tax=Phytophthora nicotianae TaxID=4792 RepID=W2PIF9_PHYN3|nr:hypothetical protein PPTG_24371 [Phytophthora nicotianae INRA-310]ETI31869.1 hypothetical protein F443_21225 [Phytophthora nicotianae P1569]ETK72232.1 hypothetical protein L915_20636 [Phytophthora nicotianae]ETO60581.1 hypothetical protein F444_21245 [Phytophthora nicotianae P1976]ETP01696.1 hypothetical protein F441_21108 [Phytophthora nicotianae CJ01A1]ETP29852.1 hypothetical protein F442_21050 [Phytophthora nicotianae P10297]
MARDNTTPLRRLKMHFDRQMKKQKQTESAEGTTGV